LKKLKQYAGKRKKSNPTKRYRAATNAKIKNEHSIFAYCEGRIDEVL
jgi:hypothetical protein